MKFELLQELERLQDESLSLEEKANLSQTMELAREGRLIPLGAFGDDVSPQLYFADEHDYLREKTRDAYFSILDLQLRKSRAISDDHLKRKSLRLIDRLPSLIQKLNNSRGAKLPCWELQLLL
jgi:hypothetical protein